jgi:hypothetical protein
MPERAWKRRSYRFLKEEQLLVFVEKVALRKYGFKESRLLGLFIEYPAVEVRSGTTPRARQVLTAVVVKVSRSSIRCLRMGGRAACMASRFVGHANTVRLVRTTIQQISLTESPSLRALACTVRMRGVFSPHV